MMFFTRTDDYQEMCDTNKNVTKMGVIIRRVYCNWVFKWKTPLTLEGHNFYKSKHSLWRGITSTNLNGHFGGGITFTNLNAHFGGA